MTTIRIREVYSTKYATNPLSGHSWPEHGPTTGYEVVGPFGVISKHKTEEQALKAKEEWQGFYDKHMIITVVK